MADLEPEITVKRFTAWRQFDRGPCPTCGRPALLQADDMVAHEDTADHALCPEVQRRQVVVDSVIESYAAATVSPFTTSYPFTVREEDLQDSGPAIIDVIRGMVVRLGLDQLHADQHYHREPPPAVHPRLAAAHNRAVGLPRSRWLAPRLRGRLGGADGWLDREQQHGGPPDWQVVDPFGSLFGYQFLRTGEYLARPTTVGEASGFDVAEIVEVIA